MSVSCVSVSCVSVSCGSVSCGSVSCGSVSCSRRASLYAFSWLQVHHCKNREQMQKCRLCDLRSWFLEIHPDSMKLAH